MPLMECRTTVDENGRELEEHGSWEFPIACYEDDFQIMDVPWHWHEEWEAVVLTRGSCLVAAGSQKVFLQAGEGFFIHSGVLHGCWDQQNSGCKFHSIVFHPRLVGGNPDSIFHQRYVTPLLNAGSQEFLTLVPQITWQKQALDTIETAWQAVTQEVMDYPLDARSALSKLTALLCRNLPAGQPFPTEKEQRDIQRIKAMLSLIHEKFSCDLNISKIAASASIGESECLRCFRSTIGITPIQYLKQYRIQQAANLLTQTNQKVSDIANACGFQDMSYFTRAFREQIGCVPTEYRKKASL